MSNPIKEQNLKLVWAEEFDGVKSIEDTDFKFAPTMRNDNIEHFNDGRNVEFKDSCMILKSVRPAVDPKYFCSVPDGLVTEGKMAFRGGYIEMRAKVPFQNGAWPSFWMITEPEFNYGRMFTEIDIFEIFGANKAVECQLHKWNGPEHAQRHASMCGKYIFPEGIDPEDWHTYGFEWTDTKFKYYVDDECYYEMGITEEDEFSDHFLGMANYNEPHHVRLNNYVLSLEPWAKDEDRMGENDGFEFIYTIDYIRLYQDPEKHTLIIKE